MLTYATGRMEDRCRFEREQKRAGRDSGGRWTLRVVGAAGSGGWRGWRSAGGSCGGCGRDAAAPVECWCVLGAHCGGNRQKRERDVGGDGSGRWSAGGLAVTVVLGEREEERMGRGLLC